MIKLLDVYKQDKKIIPYLNKKFNALFKKTDFINGNEVYKFEENFKKFIGAKYVVSCNSGTDALFIALKSLNLPEGSEVLLPAMTYCATAFSVLNAGLKPVLVDIKKNSPTICPSDIKKKITKKTKAIILVHLYGEPCDIKSIYKILIKKKIKIIEDAAQAHGAIDCSYCLNNNKTCCKKGLKVGQIGDMACFSFYPGKNLGAYGDAGLISFKNKKNFLFAKKFKNLGGIKKYQHDLIGINSRLDTLQAIVLNKKLEKIDYFNNKRKKIALIYDKNINSKEIEKINYSPGCVYHQYVIKTKKIFKLIKKLKKNQIEFGRHYPKSINKIRAFKKFFKNQKFKNAEYLAKYGISLPINPLMSKTEVLKIIKLVNSI